MPWAKPPFVDFDREPRYRWPYWFVNVEENALFGDLHVRFNIVPMFLQDPDAFHHDVTEIACTSSDQDDFYRRLQTRKEERFEELKQMQDDVSCLFLEGKELDDNQFFHYIRLSRHASLDSLIAFLTSFLGPDAKDRLAALHDDTPTFDEEPAKEIRQLPPTDSHDRAPSSSQRPPPLGELEQQDAFLSEFDSSVTQRHHTPTSSESEPTLGLRKRQRSSEDGSCETGRGKRTRTTDLTEAVTINPDYEKSGKQAAKSPGTSMTRRSFDETCGTNRNIHPGTDTPALNCEYGAKDTHTGSTESALGAKKRGRSPEHDACDDGRSKRHCNAASPRSDTNRDSSQFALPKLNADGDASTELSSNSKNQNLATKPLQQLHESDSAKRPASPALESTPTDHMAARDKEDIGPEIGRQKDRGDLIPKPGRNPVPSGGHQHNED